MKKKRKVALPVKRKRRKRELSPLSPTERKLVEDNLRIAKFAAWSAVRDTGGFTGNLSYEDLVSIANYALCVAARDFDPNKGFLFSTYASRKAQGYIQHALRDYSRLVRIPRSVVRDRIRVRGLLSKGYTPDQVSEELGLPLSRISECENSWKEIHASLDQPTYREEDSNNLHNIIPSYSEDFTSAMKRHLVDEISHLPEGTIDLLNKYYYEGEEGMEEWEILFCKNFFELYRSKAKICVQ